MRAPGPGGSRDQRASATRPAVERGSLAGLRRRQAAGPASAITPDARAAFVAYAAEQPSSWAALVPEIGTSPQAASTNQLPG